jgi:hypothetical protein
MESVNDTTYKNFGRYDNKQFILEQERRKVKDENYSPKRSFTTHYTATF